MADVKPRVFISAVTGEFESARNAVGADLRARHCDVTIQSDFKQGPDSVTLLKSLYDYIRDCHAVVCIIGKRTGAYPPKAAAERFNEMLPPGTVEASYTQWEYFFARHFNRRVYIYVANDDWKPDKAADRDDRQTTFVQFLKDRGDHRTPFSTVDQLARAVLKEEFSAKPITAPPPSGKPIVLPYPSLGALFKGRDDFMQQLHESLSRGGQTAITSKALYGLGGIGKTRAAVEYAWAHRDDYSALLFVVAETPEALRRNLAALAATLVPELDTTDDTVRLQAVLEWLAGNPGWFLILDNVDTKDALAEADALLARLSGGHLVVTSRLAHFSANFEPLALDVLPIDDAIAFLLERTRGRRRNAKDDDAKARAIAVELDGLALMLEQAGAHIAKHRLTFGSYLELWRSAQHDDALKWFDETVTAYNKAIAVTWQASVAQLTDGGRRLLERLAWLAPEKVPEFLLDVTIPEAEHEKLRDAIADLAGYSLATRDIEGPYFLVHRLVQDVTRRSLSGENRQRRLNEALSWINSAFTEDSRDVRNWPRHQPLAAHAHDVTVHAEDNGIAQPTSDLLTQLAGLLYAKALHIEAEPFLRRALDLDERYHGVDHPAVAARLNNLALLLRATSRLAEAEPLLRRALEIDEKSSRPDDLTIAIDLNNLAGLLRVTQRSAEAEPLYRRSLALREKNLSPNDPRIALGLNNLAQLLDATDRRAEAEPLYRRSLEINEKSFGPDHPTVAAILNNLALSLLNSNRPTEAEPLMRRALAIDEKSFGADHPDVARDLNNLAQLLEVTDRLVEAEQLMRRSAAIFGNTVGYVHPNAGDNLRNYSKLLAKLGMTEAEITANLKQLKRNGI